MAPLAFGAVLLCVFRTLSGLATLVVGFPGFDMRFCRPPFVNCFAMRSLKVRVLFGQASVPLSERFVSLKGYAGFTVDLITPRIDRGVYTITLLAFDC